MMNKIIAAIVGLMMLATPALAFCPGCYTPPSTANSQLQILTEGYTTVATLSTIEGWDGTPRAAVAENVYNNGVLNMWASVDFEVPSFGASEMLESKNILASGDTAVIKQVSWASPGPANTANLYIGAFASDVGTDEVDVTNVGSGSILYNVATNSGLTYLESFGLNVGTNCVPKIPVTPVLPTCVCPQGPCLC